MSVEERLAELERRLAALEERVARRGGSPSVEPSGEVREPVAPRRRRSRPAPRRHVRRRTPPSISASLVLGWTGAAVLVVAAAYLVRLGIDYGWLTADLQIGAAATAGVAMVAGGLALRVRDRPYASLLAAAGVTVLYTTVFGAHLVHHRIGSGSAIGFVGAVAIGSLALHAVYRAPLHVWFAASGAYAAPVLVQGDGGVPELALYLGVWNIVVAGYAVVLRRPWLAIATLTASLAVFALAWNTGSHDSEWPFAALFQLVTLATFGAAFVLLAVWQERPLRVDHTVALLPALIGFYAFEWSLLRGHAEGLAVPAAIGFALLLYGLHGYARARVGRVLESAWLVHVVGMVALVHAVWGTAVPQALRPLAGLAFATALVGFRTVLGAAGTWPLVGGATLLFAAGWIQLRLEGVVGPFALGAPLELLFPALPYAIHLARTARGEGASRRPEPVAWALVAVGHVQLLVGSAALVEAWMGAPGSTVERLWLSFAWAAIGIAWLAVAALREDRLLARSTLGIFGLFAVKVAFFDLAEAAPLVRVGILAVLGGSLYAGGWIYKRAVGERAPEA